MADVRSPDPLDEGGFAVTVSETHKIRASRPLLPIGRLKFLLISATSVLLLIAIVARHLTYTYTSDDVGIQDILQSWLSGQPLDAVVGVDSFFLKYPFYIFVNFLIGNSRTQLLVTVIFFAAVQAAGLFGFALFVHKRFFAGSRIALLVLFMPIAWFLSTQIDVPNVNFSSPSLLVPNGRNAEIAAALLIVIMVTKLTDVARLRPRHIVPMVLSAAALGLMTAHDPYFLYIFGPSTLVVLIVLIQRGRITMWHLVAGAGTLFAAVLVSIATSAALHEFGISNLNNAPTVIVSSEDLANSLGNTFAVYLINFNATLFGQSLNLDLVPALVNLILAVAGLWAIVSTIRRLRQSTDALQLLLFVSSTMVVVLFVLTSASTDTGHRFLYLLPFLLLPLIGLSANDLLIDGSRTLRRSVVIVVTVAILINVGFNVREIYSATRPDAVYAQSADTDTVRALESHAISKVYGDYWTTGILTYLSRRSVVGLPTNCGEYWLARKNWLTNLPDYGLPSGGHTAYVWGPRDNCSVKQVEKILGKPIHLVNVDGGARVILVFDGDIGDRIHH